MEQWRPAAGRNPCPRGNKTRPPLPGRSNVAKTHKNWTSQHIVFIARRDLWNLQRRVAADIHSFINLESKPLPRETESSLHTPKCRKLLLLGWWWSLRRSWSVRSQLSDGEKQCPWSQETNGSAPVKCTPKELASDLTVC